MSYWRSLDDIQAWQRDAEHQTAQALGKQKWYQVFQVEIFEVLRSYPKNMT